MKLKSKLGLKLGLSYLAIVVLSVIFAVSTSVANPMNPMGGLYLIIATSPWSMMMLSLFGFDKPVGFLVQDLILVLSALINGSILYFIGSFIDSLAGSGNVTDQVSRLWKKFNILYFSFFAMSLSIFLLVYLPVPEPATLLRSPGSLLIITLTGSLPVLGVIGNMITLSYFGYAITLKNKYIYLGLFGMFPLLMMLRYIPFLKILGVYPLTLSVGLITGYTILWRAKKRIIGQINNSPV